jgi:hypothetical protein
VTPDLARRALQVTQAVRADPATDVTVAWSVSRAMLDAGQTDAALALVQHTVERHPDSRFARWLQARRWVDESPLTALDVLPADPPLDALDADAVDAALILPEHYADDAAVSAWRARYDRGLHALRARRPDAERDPDARARLLRHTAFLLAYQGRDDRALQSLRGDLLAELMQPLAEGVAFSARALRPSDASAARSRLQSESLPQSRPLRVGFVSKHIRDCTVGQYFKRFLTELGDESIDVRVYACGERDAFTDEVASRTKLQHVADDANALHILTKAITQDAPEVLIYPEIGMEPLKARGDAPGATAMRALGSSGHDGAAHHRRVPERRSAGAARCRESLSRTPAVAAGARHELPHATAAIDVQPARTRLAGTRRLAAVCAVAVQVDTCVYAVGSGGAGGRADDPTDCLRQSGRRAIPRL